MSDKQALPRENLFRAAHPAIEVRADSGDGDGMPTLVGHFAVFNRWTEINSWFEGNFLERLAPGAFRKTFRENRDRIKVLFQHGADPQIGDKPLGTIDELREDDTGGYYEVPLFDTSYNRDLVPGLEAGAYGASFRFQVMREELDEEPGESDDNPKGLPERTIKEVRLYEFGPVTFPAYAEATAGLRSLTDRFLFAEIERDPARFRSLAALATTDFPSSDKPEDTAPPVTPAAPKGHRDDGRRDTDQLYGLEAGKEHPSWLL